MRLRHGILSFLVFPALLAISPAQAQTIPNFTHIVVIVQENRTPDNLFYGLCTSQNLCSTNPTSTQYDIQTSNWLNKAAQGGVTQPFAVPLAGGYGLSHSHAGFVALCDLNPATNTCRMDGAAGVGCSGACPSNPQFAYVDNSTGTLAPYLTLATEYGWANYFFQTNQGPSFPAHQYLFGATSAPSATDDEEGTFAADNTKVNGGCVAPPGTTVQLIDAFGIEHRKKRIFPCFEHSTIPDLLAQSGYTWRYYAPSQDSMWTAPDAINHICVPSDQTCTGSLWTANVDLTPSDVLKDVGACNLRNVTWAMPSGQNSDHPKVNDGGGPSWVASIVNAIGNSPCKDGATTYWQDTAIIITWDDWGGFYDHEPPKILAFPQGGYQLGARVPMIVVSAYTARGYIDNKRHDFGSIARFIEHNFGFPEGKLDFADARATTDLESFFRFKRKGRLFHTIPSRYDAKHFLNDKSPPLPPDDD
jgi:phospholipase C